MPTSKQLILFIDAYDSFSNNIISFLETELGCSVRVIEIDDPILLSSTVALNEELSHYAAVVCGPGPGHPGNQKDVGIMSRIWRLEEANILPVLGICLGFQSLCLECEGVVRRLEGPQHGLIRRVTHIGESAGGEKSIFGGVGRIDATLYQSLCADIGQNQEGRDVWETKKWEATSQCPDLLPMAWVESDGAESDSGIMDERVLVAVQHRTKPFCALQYHPESICTNTESRKVITNWFAEAQRWNRTFRLKPVNPESPNRGHPAVRESLLRKCQPLSHLPVSAQDYPATFGLNANYRSRIIKLPVDVSVPDLVEAVQDLREDQIILESSNVHERSAGSADVKGRYSIIGLSVDETLRLEYRTGEDYIVAIYPGHQKRMIDLRIYGGIWSFISHFLARRRISDGIEDSPFWGGFMGYTTYELGLEGIYVASTSRKVNSHSRPDLCFAWVTRSLAIDHVKGQIYLQELVQDTQCGQGWMDAFALKIEALSVLPADFLHPLVSSSHPLMASANSSQISLNLNSTGSQSPLPQSSKNSIYSHDSPKTHMDSITSINTPCSEAYESKVRLCQEYIRGGDSYELCLTDQTTVRRQRFDSSSKSAMSQRCTISSQPGPGAWHLYRTLRARQPAPFASFIRLGPATLISSSPERFLAYSRNGQCELRPMKGTVRKSPAVPSLAEAIPLLDIPKEKAENLMIVDLVRHDLYGVCGSGMVQVPRLMVVEEYRSVFQMISVVQGQIPQDNRGYTGLDVLAASLPPGSMTGAPKKRSCEILQEVEGKERSLYSGVVGYMDVGGRGDWSVNIRCMFRWDDEDEVLDDERRIETWHIGAGGAVTTLSTPDGERDEMLTKLNGTLGVFR